MFRHIKIFIFCFIIFSGICFYYGNKANQQFKYGYYLGYVNVQDSITEFDLKGCIQPYGHYTEGIFDYWDETSFWYQQGYEEGVKKGTRDYLPTEIELEDLRKF